MRDVVTPTEVSRAIAAMKGIQPKSAQTNLQHYYPDLVEKADERIPPRMTRAWRRTTFRRWFEREFGVELTDDLLGRS